MVSFQVRLGMMLKVWHYSLQPSGMDELGMSLRYDR